MKRKQYKNYRSNFEVWYICNILNQFPQIMRKTWAQFHQRSTRSFCAGRLTPVKYKPKT